MSPDPKAAGAPSPALVFETLFAYQRTAALRAAIELDLFRAIGEGPGDVPSLARRCSASERGVRILCDFLTIGGLVSKVDGRYAHTPTSAMFLDPRSPACVASTAGFLGNPSIQEPFDRLAEVVRTGRTRAPGAGDGRAREPGLGGVRAQHGADDGADGRPARLDRARRRERAGVGAGHRRGSRAVRDRGGEAEPEGPRGRGRLGRGARCRARERAPGRGRRTATRRRPGSAFEVEYGGPHDIALLTNFLHHFDPPTCVRLLKKVNASLKRGGCVAALEFVPNDDRVSPPMAASFSLTMLATTAAGDAYTLPELAAMYREAGFAQIAGHPVPMGPHTVVVGRAV